MANTLCFQPKAGLPPWLFLILVLLIVRMPESVEQLQKEFDDQAVISEHYHVQLAVAKIEDASSRFPVELDTFAYDKDFKAWIEQSNREFAENKKNLEEWLKNRAATESPPYMVSEFKYQKEYDAWMETQQHKQEERQKLIQEWLQDGAAARFRRDSASALAEISQAQHIEESQVGLLRQAIEAKRDIMASYLEELEEADLREAVNRETGLHPEGTDKAGLIGFLLETNEAKRRSMSQNWVKAGGIQLTDFSELADRENENSLEVWRAKFELIMMWPSRLLDLAVLLAPLIALINVLFPHLRGRFVEWKNGLVMSPQEIPELAEIAEFVHSYVPRLELRSNLIKPGLSFVYPGGYCRPRLAVLNNLYTLWRRDRAKAELVLLHELEHVRQGDYLLVGYGSLFPKYVKLLVNGALGITVALLIFNLGFSMISLGFNFKHQTHLLGVLSPLAVGLPLGLFFLTLNRIITPLFCIWGSEFNADYGVSLEKSLTFNPLMVQVQKFGIAHRILGGVTHPPLWLRTWLAVKENWIRDVVRHLVVPTAYFVALILLILMGLSMKLPTDGFKVQTLFWLLGLALDAFANRHWIFIGMGVILLVWPFIAPHWERLFAGKGRTYAWWDTGRSVAALVLFVLGGLGYLIGSTG